MINSAHFATKKEYRSYPRIGRRNEDKEKTGDKYRSCYVDDARLEADNFLTEYLHV